MTVAVSTGPWSYTGDGATTGPYAFDSKIFQDSELLVYLDGVLQTLTTHYTVTGAGDADGGYVTFVTAPAASAAVLITRNVTISQPTRYPEGGAFPSSAHEQGMDRNVIVIQQLQEALGRAVQMAVTSALSNIVFPDPGAGELIRWNAGGTALETVGAALLDALTLPVGFSDGGTGGSYADLATLLAAWDMEIGTDLQAYDAATAKTDGRQSWTEAQHFTPLIDATPGATPTANFQTRNVIRWTTSANITGVTISNTNDGGVYDLYIQQGGAHTLTGFSSSIKWLNNVAPDTFMPQTANSILHIQIRNFNGTLFGSYAVFGAA